MLRRSCRVRLDPRAPRGATLIMERGQFGVWERLEPGLQRFLLAQRCLQPLPVAQFYHAPAATAEDLVEPLEHTVGAGRVEALAVVIDDPPQVTDVVLRALDNRFVDIAFVELGIANERNEAAAVLVVEPTM